MLTLTLFVYLLRKSQEESGRPNYILSNYSCFHQYRQYRRGEGVYLFWKTRQDMSINCDAIESLCLEMTNEKSKNVILNLTYRLPNGGVNEFEKHLNKTPATNGLL